MRLTGSRTYYRPSPPKMPPGLVELMEGMTREVLKNNPTDVYGFCAAHMQDLLEKRDGPLTKKKLSLEEKIARAQEKVRQRAEKRRQEYDRNMLLLQKSVLASDNTLKSDKNNETSSENIDEKNALIHHDKDSSEVDVSHDNDIETHITIQDKPEISPEINTLAEVIKIELVPENAMSVEILNAEIASPIEKVETDLVLSNAPDSDATNIDKKHKNDEFEFILTGPSIDQSSEGNNVEEKDEFLADVDIISNDTPDALDVKNDLSPDLSGVFLNEDTKIELPINDSSDNKVEEVSNSEIKESTDHSQPETKNNELINSEIEVTNDFLPHANTHHNQENKIEEIVQGTYNVKDIQDSTDNTNNHEQSDMDEDHSSKDVDESSSLANTKDSEEINNDIAKELNNTEIEIKNELQTNDIKIGQDVLENEQIVSNINEDNNLLSTQDNHDKDSAMLEHEAHSINEVVLESQKSHNDLPGTGTDSDIDTLVTEDSNIDTQTQLDDTKSDSSVIMDSDNIKSKLDQSNTEPVAAISDIENLNNIHQHSSLDLTTDSVGGVIEGTSASSENNDMINCEDVNSTKEGDSPQSNMNLETAAITIQKVFRNFLFKSRASTFEDSVNDDSHFSDEDDKNKKECDFPIASTLNIDRRPHGITRMDTVLQTVNEEKSLSLSTDDSSTLSSAATIIQAHVRGFLVRNKLNSNKTISTNSLAASNSNEPSLTSLEADNDHNKNKTVLNIHIVPEGEQFLSRDESLITSMDLSLDGSPPSSVNLHPLGYDVSERRKLLKREDAIQSISPPSNNSGKLSEDVDSVKEFSLHENMTEQQGEGNIVKDDLHARAHKDHGKIMPIGDVDDSNLETLVKMNEDVTDDIEDGDVTVKINEEKRASLTKMNSDEMDVVTPFISIENKTPEPKLMHTGEFHDTVLPTKVSRSDTSVTSGE